MSERAFNIVLVAMIFYSGIALWLSCYDIKGKLEEIIDGD